MIEVELKYKLSVFGSLDNSLHLLGARCVETHHEHDVYFKHPGRDFAQTDEALRIRRTGIYNCITYKGPKLDAHTKTRFELEIPLGCGEGTALHAQALFEVLGFCPIGVVFKQRSVWCLDNYNGFTVSVMQDQVKDLGAFLELEILAVEERVAAARDTLFALAEELGLGQSERRSYLELLLAARATQEGDKKAMEQLQLPLFTSPARESVMCIVCGRPVGNLSALRLRRPYLWCSRECFLERPRKIIALERMFHKDIVDVLKVTTKRCDTIKGQCKTLHITIPYLYTLFRKYGDRNYVKFMADNATGKRKDMYNSKLRRRKKCMSV